jgi:osmotically-inducible protein OsmY
MKTTKLFTIFGATLALLITSTSMQASETDKKIESAAAKSYVFKTYLKDDSVKTESKHGVVTLTGTVSEASHSSLAQDTVENLPGVKSVDNQLVVKGEPPGEHSDSWICAKVKTTLLFHRHVSATGTTVYVKDGVVTLQGEAGSLAERDLTTEYVKDIDNVKEVKNDMTVAAAPAAMDSTVGDKVDDASITAQVKASLLAHHSTSALHTKISTANGVVSVNGVAKNAAEKALVSKLAGDINGVDKVINNMTVEVVAASNS